MTPLLQILFFQAALPLLLLAWLACVRERDRGSWLLKGVAVVGYTGAAAVAGLWTVLPWWLAYLWIALAVFLVAAQVPSALALPGWVHPGRWRVLGRLALAAIGLAAFVVMALGVVDTRAPAGEAADLEFPLRGGPYYVASGGSGTLVNPHVKTLRGERLAEFRGQGFGLDIVKLDRWGLRADGLLPDEPEAYRIFGEPVHAPCSGTVTSAENGLPDLGPPDTDRDHPAGNHVLLDCGHFVVLLAHLQRGSVSVLPDDWVKAGTQLGRVGNSGNSSEPHLHVHAQRHGSAPGALDGDPVPIAFDGRFLVRNDRVTQREAQ